MYMFYIIDPLESRFELWDKKKETRCRLVVRI
jgi:hypothetical protein